MENIVQNSLKVSCYSVMLPTLGKVGLCCSYFDVFDVYISVQNKWTHDSSWKNIWLLRCTFLGNTRKFPGLSIF